MVPLADALPHSLQIWDNAARLALPLWLKGWLAFLGLSVLASLFFVRRHMAARWALAGFAASHLMLVAIAVGELATVRTGLVSLTHVLGWTPVLVVLARELPRSQAGTAYGTWCRVLLGVIAVALIFDYRDATLYLYYQLAGS